MNIGCCISLKNIKLAKDFYYDFIELSATEIMKIDDSAWNKKKNIIIESGLPVLSLYSFCDDNLPIVGPKVNKIKLISYLEKLILRASELDVKNIGIGAPEARIIPGNFPYSLAQNQMEYFLNTASEIASDKNIKILYEAISPKLCNFGNSTLEIYETINKIDSNNLGIVWDLFHSANSNEDLNSLQHVFDLVSNIHICSWDSDLKRSYELEKNTYMVNNLINYLKSIGYNRNISIEAPDNNFNKTGKEAISLLRTVIVK